jgi:hypothetical protein
MKFNMIRQLILPLLFIYSCTIYARISLKADLAVTLFEFDAFSLAEPLGCVYIEDRFYSRFSPGDIIRGTLKKDIANLERVLHDLGNPGEFTATVFIDGFDAKKPFSFCQAARFIQDKSQSRDQFALRNYVPVDQQRMAFVTDKIKGLRRLRKYIKENNYEFTVNLTWVFMLPEDEREAMRQTVVFSNFEDAGQPGITSELYTTTRSELDWCDENGKNYVGSVKHQGSCGSCWAFSTTSAFEAAIMIAEDRPDLRLDLSEQTMVTGCSNAGDCTNGDSYVACRYMFEQGIPSEECDPYTAEDEPCIQCSWVKSDLRKAYEYQRVTQTGDYKDYAKIIAALQKHPVSTHVATWDNGFDAYTGGIFSYEGDEAFLSDHAVCLVGFSEEQDYWKLKNSWGDDWGEQGFMRCRRGQGHRLGEYACEVDYYPLSVDAGPDTILLVNDPSVQLNATVKDGAPDLSKTPPDDYTYEWTPSEGLSDPTIKNPVASPQNTTLYIFTATDINVSKSDSVLILKDPVGNGDHFTPLANDRLIVNPGMLYGTSYVFRYSFRISTPVEVRVINVAGRTVLYQQYGLCKGFGSLAVNMNSIPYGIYFVSVRTPDMEATAKIIVLK